MLDQAQDSQPQVQQALDGVTRLQLRYLDGDGNWQSSWPPSQGSGEEQLKELPRAIELILEHRHYGELRRLLRLPDVMPEGAEQTPADESPEQTEPDVEPSP
ncbi:type II secretion system protein J [compost metagenome]